MSDCDAAPGCAGWFGKIPSLGDFARRGLPASFTQPWDEWLSEELSSARDMLGARWAAAYEQAPIVCFSLGADVLGRDAWHGIIVPSYDRVRREYPLTLAQSRPRHAVAPTRLQWWVELVTLSRGALDRACSAEELDRDLARFFREGPATADAPEARSESVRVSVDDGASAWWLWSSEGPTMVIPHTFAGLPRGVVQRYGSS